MKYLFLSCIILVLSACGNNKRTPFFQLEGKKSSISIKRFDKEMYVQIYNEGCRDFSTLERGYPRFWNIYTEAILGINPNDSTDLETHLRALFYNEDIQKLYIDAIKEYDDIEDIRKELYKAFNILSTYIPNISIPEIYMHVSGLNQSIVVGDGFLSLSIDKYLGEKYPLYQSTFYSYERKHMNRKNVSRDYIASWYYSEYPQENGCVLDNIIYYGRLYYLFSLLFPNLSEKEYMDYTEEEIKWLTKNEKSLWTTIINDKKLYQEDRLYTSKLVNDAPFSAFGIGETPGKVGTWIGLHIIRSYVTSHKKISLSELLEENDFKKILEESNYDPHS